MKLAGGCPSLADQLNVDAFLEQARSYEKAASSPVGWYIRFVVSSVCWHHYKVELQLFYYKLNFFCLLGTLKQANCHILCLFYVLVKSMNGQEVQLIDLF